MLSNRLLPLAFGILTGSFAVAAETWETASTRLQAHVGTQQGPGAIVQLERVDARTVRVRLKTLWPGFRGASLQSAGETGLKQSVGQLSAGAQDIVHLATIDPRDTRLEVRLYGADFNPKIMMKLPAPGQAEVGTVLMGNPRSGI